MIFSEIIRKKRDGFELSLDEVEFVIKEYTEGRAPDYQMSALLMAMLLKGMNEDETLFLTEAMLDSGRKFDLSAIKGRKIDKHSTGGVGDKVSLILAPLVASCGVIVPMISGRGLGHTGGTLDKLESIPDFRTSLDYDEFYGILEKVGVAIMGQTDEIAPADRRMYSLRDVTGTVESIPLITASILSKKLAEGIDGLVLDVKCGEGAFMKSFEDAEKLASAMDAVVKGFGKESVSIITNMDQPLGTSVGNSLEVKESIESLKGNGASDLMEVTYWLGAEMLLMGGVVSNKEDALSMLKKAIGSGRALDKFIKMIELQGGNPKVIDDYALLPLSKNNKEIRAENAGFIEAINAYEVGIVNLLLGGGRRKKEDEIDPAVGIVFEKKVGDRVERDETIAIIYYRDNLSEDIEKRFVSAVKISERIVKEPPIILNAREQ
jgi:pyrimidine-nucleoside phosphorylase